MIRLWLGCAWLALAVVAPACRTATELFADERRGQPGAVDDSFGPVGPELGIRPFPTFAVLPDGRLLFAGLAPDAGTEALVRLTEDGAPDPTFGQGGASVSTCLANRGNPPRGVEPPTPVALPDGSVVVLTFRQPGFGSYPVLARFSPDGRSSRCIECPDFERTAGSFDDFGSLTLAADGALLLVGSGRTGLAIARVDAECALDATFGAGGVIRLDWSEATYVSGIVARADGRILVATGLQTWVDGPDQLNLWAFEQNGAPVATGSPKGRIELPQVPPDYLGRGALALVGADTSFAAAGNGVGINLFRLNDVSRDLAFGGAFPLSLPGAQVGAAVADAAGNLVIAAGANKSACYLVRARPDGSLDEAFSGGPRPSRFNYPCKGLGLQPDGRIVIASDESTNPWRIRVERVWP